MKFSLSNLYSRGKKQGKSGPSLIEKRWGTIVSLLGIFAIALFIRSYFAFDLATKYGIPYLVSGGSDAYYYVRIIDFIQENHHHLWVDPLRKYPLVGINPRPPLFAWSVVLGGYVLTPIVGNANTAISYVFILSTGIWGALTVFPTYLIGRNAFGKKAGLAAAFLFAISSGHLQRSMVTNGDHDAIYLFFAVTAFYFFMRSLQDIRKERNWVMDWFDKEKIKSGLLEFIKENKRPLLYAGMSGVAIGSVALTWKGFPYVIVIILVYLAFQLIFDKFKGRDSLGVTACVFVSVGVAFLIAAPYYVGVGMTELPFGIGKWFDTPLLLFLFAISVAGFFTVTRDYPWLIILSVLAIGLTVFFVLGTFFFEGLINSVLSGAGYFIQNKLYSTIAEAQAPPFSNLVLSFGIVSFFLSIIGIALAIWHLKGKWNADFIFILIWTAFAIYMAMSAARFIFNSSPAFALTAGWVIALVVDKADFGEVSRRFRSFRGDFKRGLYEGVKIKHILTVLFVVFLILIPNTMYAFDAGIPYEDKQIYNDQIHKSIPQPLKPGGYNASQNNLWYLGAFGYSMDKPTDYWPAAWDWLSKQDTELRPEDRPAFLSWWDYGFECIREGKHPTVADNFQVGYRLAGNMLMSQNESEMISLLIARELEKPFNEDREFNDEVRNILIKHIDEEKTEELEEVYRNPASFKEEVLSNPERYHPRAEDIHPENVRYAKIMGLLSYESVYTLGELYRDLSLELDLRIKYLAADSRLFPFSAQQTGVFYAPAKLSGHRIDDSRGMRTPVDFFSIKYVTTTGMEYEDPDLIPSGESIQDYKINYKPMFYNSTLYRIMVGYSGQEVGQAEGIPSLNQQLRQQQPLPGWNMTHFKMTYRTAYYNPYPEDEFRNHTDAWRAVNFEEAKRLREETNGTVDISGMNYLQNGVAFLEYYDGAIVKGTVTTKEGKPVPDAKITILDENYAPHDTGRTDERGQYEVIAPSGSVTVIVTTGGGGRAQIQTESITLNSTSFNVSEAQAMRKKVDRNGDGRWDYNIKQDFEIDSSVVKGNIYIDEDSNEEYNSENDTLVPGNVRLVSQDSDLKFNYNSSDGSYEFNNVVPGKYTLKTNLEGTSPITDISVKPNDEVTNNIELSTSQVNLSISFDSSIEHQNIDLIANHQLSGKDNILSIEGDGEYSYKRLAPGNYLLSVKTEGYTFRDGEIKLDLQNDTQENISATITSGTELKGSTSLNGDILANQKLSFVGLDDQNYNQTITSDNKGEFSLKLPNGNYRIYGKYIKGDERYVSFDTISIPEENRFNAVFEKSYNLEGNVIYEREQLDSFNLLFKNNTDKTVKVPVTDGEFSVNLIPGQYELYGWRFNGDNSRVVWRNINLNEDKSITLYAKKGKEIDGFVYRDLDDDNAYDNNEGLSAYLDVKLDNRNIFEINSEDNGRYRFVIPYQDIDLTINKNGYITQNISISSVEKFNDNIALDANNVEVKGDITTEKAFESLSITFKAIGEGAVTKDIQVDGYEYSTSIKPGIYEAIVDYTYENGNKALQFSKQFEVEPGQETLELPIELKENVKIEGTINDEEGLISASIIFDGPEKMTINTNGEFELYLIPGKYSVRAINEDRQLSKQVSLEVTKASFISINLENMIDFSGVVTYAEEPKEGITVVFKNQESNYELTTSTDDSGEANIALVPGHYEVTVEQELTEKVNDIEKKFKYSYSETFFLNSTTIRQISLERELSNATVSGIVTLEETGIEGINLEFIGNGPAGITTSTTTASSGSYEVKLTSGDYSVYVFYENKKIYSKLGQFQMGVENKLYNITLNEGVEIEGTIRKDNQPLSADMTVINLDTNGKKELTVEDDGYYSIILPKGNYQLIAQTDLQESYGSVSYRNSKNVELDNSKIMNLDLTKIKEYGVDIGDVDKKVAEQGDEIKYIISLKNTGNTRDTYKISPADSPWGIEFNPSQIEIDPSETKQIEVIVKVDDNALVDHAPVRFKVNSMNSDEEEQKTIPIDIKPVYNVDILSKLKNKDFKNGVLTYKISVKNTGNVMDSFKLEVINKNVLERNGWKASIENTTNLVDAEETGEVTVQLKAVARNPSDNVKVEITATSNNDSTASRTNEFKVELPTITGSRESFKLTGEQISDKQKEFSLELWQWTMIILIVGFITIYIVRKERWI